MEISGQDTGGNNQNEDQQKLKETLAYVERRNMQQERLRLSRERRELARERELRQKELTQFQNRVSIKPEPTFDHLEHTDKSRRHIAFVFVYGYIIIVLLVIIGIPAYNKLALNQPNNLDLDKILSQVGALIGSPLGFVVGYYFKEDTKK